MISALEESDAKSEIIGMAKLGLKGHVTAPDSALLMSHVLASSNVRNLYNHHGLLLIEKTL